MNYFDIAIIIITLSAMLIGFAKGFIKSLGSLFGWIISIAFAILLAKPIANALIDVPFISKYFFNNPSGFSFSNWIYGILPENLRIDMTTVRSWMVVDGNIVDGAKNILVDNIKDKNGLLGMFMGLFKGSYVESLASAEMLTYNVDNLARGISILLANSLLILFSAILLLIVFKIISNIIINVFGNAFEKKESLTAGSRLLGMIIGTLKGILTCAAMFVILSFMINFPFLEKARDMLFEEKSMIAGQFATTVFETTDSMIKTKDIDKIMSSCGYEKNIDLSSLPNETDQNEEDTEINKSKKLLKFRFFGN